MFKKMCPDCWDDDQSLNILISLRLYYIVRKVESSSLSFFFFFFSFLEEKKTTIKFLLEHFNNYF